MVLCMFVKRDCVDGAEKAPITYPLEEANIVEGVGKASLQVFPLQFQHDVVFSGCVFCTS